MCFLVLVMVPGIVSAQNASFSTLGQSGSQDVLIYTYDPVNNTQQLYGQWNTSSPYVPLPGDDFNLVVKPSARARFFDPGLLLQDGFAYVETNLFPILVLCLLIGMLWKK